jgi:plasmid maintenance system antidote protein VapI
MKKGIFSIMKKNNTDIETQLKQYIEHSGMTCYRLAEASGVNKAQLSYFMNGKRSLSLPSAAKLAKALGLELRKVEDNNYVA